MLKCTEKNGSLDICNSMKTGEEDLLVRLKAPEKLLNGPWGEVVLSGTMLVIMVIGCDKPWYHKGSRVWLDWDSTVLLFHLNSLWWNTTVMVTWHRTGQHDGTGFIKPSSGHHFHSQPNVHFEVMLSLHLLCFLTDYCKDYMPCFSSDIPNCIVNLLLSVCQVTVLDCLNDFLWDLLMS